MKAFLSLIMVFILMQSISAQEMKSGANNSSEEISQQIPDYFDGNPEWRESFTLGLDPCIEYYDYVFYVEGDTVIGDYVYKKIHKRGQVYYSWIGIPPPYNCEGTETFNYFAAHLRQEDRKIYIYESGQDYLLFDFNLEAGDLLPQTHHYFGDSIYVTSVDSLLVGGDYRMVYNLSSGYFDPDQLIEGIGYAFGGLMGYYPSWEFPAFLDCFALDGVTWFPEYGAWCDLTVDIEEIGSNPGLLKIYQHPASRNITLNFTSNITQTASIDFFDITGRHVTSVDWVLHSGTNTKSMNLASLRQGIYILKLSSPNDPIGIRKKMMLK